MIASARSRRRLSRSFSRLIAANSVTNGLDSTTFGPRLTGRSASKAPAARCRRQSVSADE